MSRNNPEHWKARVVADARRASSALWSDTQRKVDERGLATTCSQCDAKAVWYGKGGVAYCDEHWPGERYEWTHNTRETETKID